MSAPNMLLCRNKKNILKLIISVLNFICIYHTAEPHNTPFLTNNTDCFCLFFQAQQAFGCHSDNKIRRVNILITSRQKPMLWSMRHF